MENEESVNSRSVAKGRRTKKSCNRNVVGEVDRGASPDAESKTKLPDRTRAWRVFDLEIGPFTFFGTPANQTANLKWIPPRKPSARKLRNTQRIDSARVAALLMRKPAIRLLVAPDAETFEFPGSLQPKVLAGL